MSTDKIIVKVVCFLVTLCQFAVGDNAYSDLPNVVVYLSDDHSQFDCQLYGANDIPTPNFEKLANDGLVFTHAFLAWPSCAPSRDAMLTGLMPDRNGAEANHTRAGTHYLEDLKKPVTAFRYMEAVPLDR